MPIINLVYEAPREWKPGSNTIAYYPLNSTTTVNDMSGNSRNLTNNGATFGTYGGVDCVYLPSANTKKLYGTLPLTGNQNFTFSFFIWRVGNSYLSGGNDGSQLFLLGNIGSSGGCFGTAVRDANNTTNPNKYLNYTWGNDKVSSTTNTIGRREYIVVTNNNGTIKMYRNGVLINDNSISFNVNSTNFTIGSFPTANGGNYQNFYGYISEFIVENNGWTQDYINQYLNTKKELYGIS